jgi:biopolymer transport protein ExbD
MIFRHTSGNKSINENSQLIPTATMMLILTAIIILTMIFANLALVTLTYASSDPFATEESKPSCAEIERNDDLYFDLGK